MWHNFFAYTTCIACKCKLGKLLNFFVHHRQSSIGNMIEETKDKQDSLDEGIMKRWKQSRCRPKGESRRPVRGFIEGKKRVTIHDGEGSSSRSMQQDKFYRRRDHPKHKQRQRSRSVSSEDFYLRTAAGHIGRQKTSSSNQERVKECVTANSKEQGTFISSNVKLFEVEQKPNLICEHHANHKTVIQTVSIDMHNEKSSLPTNGRLIGKKKEPIRKRIYEQDKFGGDKSIPYRKTPGNFNRKGEEKSSIDKINEERRIKVECESTNDEKCLVPKFVDGKFIERYQNHKARTFKKDLPVKPNFADDLSSKGNTDNRQMSHTRKRKKHSIHMEKSSNSDTPWEEIHHTERKERKRSKKIYRSDADIVPFELPVDWQRKKLSGTKFPNKKYDDYVEGSIIVPIKAEVVQSEGKKTRQKETRRKSHDSDSTSGIHRKKRKKSHKRKQSKALIKGSIS